MSGLAASKQHRDWHLYYFSWYKCDFTYMSSQGHRTLQTVGHTESTCLPSLRRSIMYTAGSGKFSSDRTIREYAEDIWNVSADGREWVEFMNTHAHTRARARTHTHTHTNTHARTHTHTNTHTQLVCAPDINLPVVFVLGLPSIQEARTRMHVCATRSLAFALLPTGEALPPTVSSTLNSAPLANASEKRQAFCFCQVQCVLCI